MTVGPEFETLLWALGFMLATFLLGGALYGAYQWLIRRRP
jgi:hypothetical protein